ncbi:MAG: YggS family pyridoxal phosphate-dependent enzyme [Bdellovibrionales bacterium]
MKRLRERVHAACRRSGRPEDAVQILAVSKYQSLNKIREAFDCGQRDFAENYVQEALYKQEQLYAMPVNWHFIGRIQSNKVKFLAGRFSKIHSVDRGSIVETLHRLAPQRPQQIFLQFNAANESTKAGADEIEIENLMNFILERDHIRTLGLMVMPPPTDTPATVRPYFMRARKLMERLRAQLTPEMRERHPLNELSMGTSQDYEVAIEEGSTWIRVGTDVFGPREENG